jgi:hypothetical protein
MAEQKHRYLAVGLNLEHAQLEDQPDGSLLVKNVPLLKVGQWTDSAVKTALDYPMETLAAYATNWRSNSYWSRHSGGVPRDMEDKIALIQEPRFMGDGVYADLLFHRTTEKSRGLAAYLVKMKALGQDVFSSVEHIGDEAWNPQTGKLEATSITFLGAAMVDQGACKTCQILGKRTNEVPGKPAENAEYPWDQCISDRLKEGYSQDSAEKVCGSIKNRESDCKNPELPKQKDHRDQSDEMTAEDVKKLEDQIRALSDALTKKAEQPPAPTVDVQIKALEAKIVEKDAQVKQVSDLLTEAGKQLSQMGDRVEALETNGTARTGGNQPSELEEPMNSGIAVDRSTGTVRRV